MQIKVRVFINNNLVKPSELSALTIKNNTVDRIVNDVVQRNQQGEQIAATKVS